MLNNDILRYHAIGATSEKVDVCSILIGPNWSNLNVKLTDLELSADGSSWKNNYRRNRSMCTKFRAEYNEFIPLFVLHWKGWLLTVNYQKPHYIESKEMVIFDYWAVLNLLFTPKSELGRFYFTFSTFEYMSHQIEYKFKRMYN